MERYRRFLVDNGIIHLKTDSNFLFTYTSYMVDGNQLPLIVRTTALYSGLEDEALTLPRAIQTYYESMWMERGISIKYQCFRLPHEGVLTEPEIEIELDEYRSYHRDKRSGKQTAK
jgi:tRNA (guanine-N7-)-methyltransferase